MPVPRPALLREKSLLCGFVLTAGGAIAFA